MHEKEIYPPLTLVQGSELPVHVTWAVLGASVALPRKSRAIRRLSLQLQVASWVTLNRVKFILVQGNVAHLNRGQD